jgi:acyl-CoA synthetase (AMP-forming)/AMP-acid ligase II
MPFFHVGGTVTAMSTLMAAAGTHIFLPSFRPGPMAAAIERERPDAILAVPTMLISLAEYADAHGLPFASLETVLTGGAPVPETVAARWIDGFGVGISNTYGLTEVSGPAVATAPTDPRERAVATCGRPLPGIEVEIVTPGTIERVALEDEGEIRFRGWGLMNGYLHDREATEAVVDDDGWFASGDLGRLGADGFVQVTGRAKDVIIRGGENIAPAAVEDAIREHVSWVVDVSVVGAGRVLRRERRRVRDAAPPDHLDPLRARGAAGREARRIPDPGPPADPRRAADDRVGEGAEVPVGGGVHRRAAVTSLPCSGAPTGVSELANGEPCPQPSGPASPP